MKKLFFILSITALIGVLASCEKDVYEQPVPTAQEEVQSKASLKSSKSYFSFNSSNAVDYALDYTVPGINLNGTQNSHAWSETYYNSDYKVWYDNNGDNTTDCANFVSQCLSDNSGGDADTDGSWWYNNNGTSSSTGDDYSSSSWRLAHLQYNYFKNNYYVTSKFIRSVDYSGESDSDYRTFKSTLSLGDLIYFETEDDYGYMVIDHVMIVTKIVDMGSYNIVYVSGHTINQKNEKLHDVFTYFEEAFFARTMEF